MRRALVFGLRARNINVLTASEADMINREDEEQLMAASASGRALFSYNTADYCVLHQRWMSLERTRRHHRCAATALFGWRRTTKAHVADRRSCGRTDAEPVRVS